MNVERLQAVAERLKKDLEGTAVVSTLQNLASSLQNQVNQPQQAQFQQQTSEHLTKLLKVLDGAAVNDFSPTWQQVLDDIEATDLTGSRLASRIRDIFARNQITPAVALHEIQALAVEVQKLSEALNNLLSALQALKIGAEEPDPGECELGVLVPRAFLDNRLDQFASELGKLDQIFGVFAEIATGSRPGFVIKTVSSSDLSVYLDVAAQTGACIATAIGGLVVLYKNLLEIRKLKGELIRQGVDDKSLHGIEDHANGIMDLGIDKLAKELLSECRAFLAWRRAQVRWPSPGDRSRR